MDWSKTEAPSLDDFELLARDAFAGLPEEFRALVEGIVFAVQDFPDPDVMADMELESEFEILGLFHGP
ncbi:MAG: metallopeptidase family protein, partial [Rhizomicrobium sp.]